MKYLLIIPFLFSVAFAQTIPAKQVTGLPGATIYVHDDGLSTGTGSTQATAVNAARLAAIYAGGEKIYLASGGSYTIDFDVKSNTTIAPYGEGAKPIINGTIPSTSLTWTQNGTVWSASVASRVGGVFLAGARQKTAQSAFYTVTSAGGSTINASAATGLSNVTAMEMIAKEKDYRWSWYDITAYNSGTGSFDVDRTTSIGAGYKFILFNHPDLISAEGDWAWLSGTIYYKSPGNVNPNTLDLELSVEEEGIRIEDGATNVTIDGLNFYGQAIDGIYSNDNSNITITNCTFTNQLSHGIALVGDSKSITIENNIFEDIGFTAIGGYKWTDFKIIGNTISDIGTQVDPPFTRFQSLRYDNLYAVNSGIVVSTNSSQGIIQGNIINKAAYLGIRADGHQITIDRNNIDSAMMRATDGGGIYTAGDMGDGTTSAYEMTISNNVVSNCKGSLEGIPGSTFNMANGIYIDFFSERVKVIGNTCYDNGTYGAYTGDDTRYNEFNGNVFYNNAKAQFAIYNSSVGTGGYVSTAITLTNNTLASLNTTQYGIWIQSATNGDDPFDGGGNASNNTFINPYNSLAARVTFTSTDYTVSEIASYLSEEMGEADSYSTSFVNEATAKANVPLRLNTTNATTIAVVPSGFHNPNDKYFDPVLAPFQGTVFITGAPSVVGGAVWSSTGSGTYGITASNLTQTNSADASFWIKSGEGSSDYAQILVANDADALSGGKYMQIIRFPNGASSNAGDGIFYNQGQRIVLSTNNGGTYREDLVVQSGGAVRFSDAYSFPTSIGSPGQRLAVPSSGTGLIWDASGGTQWDDITASSRNGINYAGGFVSINTTSPFPGVSNSDYLENGLDIAGAMLMIGNNASLDGRTNNTEKVSRIVSPMYANAEEPFGLLISSSSSTDNSIFYGGASGAVNAATLHAFYAASNNVTTTGTQVARITINGVELTAGQITVDTQFTPANSTDSAQPNKTLAADDTYLYYRTSSGTWKKIAWTTF